MRPGEFKILAALMNVPNGLTYTKLKEITELSSPVISKYLSGFVREGMILKDNKDRLYRLASAYQPRQIFLGDLERGILTLMRSIPFEGSRIALVRDQDLRRKIYEDFFSFHMNCISILVVMAIRNSLIQVLRENGKKEQDLLKKLPKLKRKDARRFAARLAGTWESELAHYHSAIHERMLNWVIPYIQMLALAYRANAQFTLAGIDKGLPERLTKEAVEKTFWFKQLEAIDKQLAEHNPKFAKLLKRREELERKLESKEAGNLLP